MPEVTGTLKEIKEFWEQSAKAPVDAQGLRPTARDPYLQDAVEHLVLGRLHSGNRVIDVGCGDGASSLLFAKRVQSVLGVDYVAEFAKRANASASESGIANARFEEGSAMDLSPTRKAHGRFDVAISIRCLINLSTWENQQKAIREIAECIEPGGLFLASEGWQEGIDGLNLRRRRAGLEAIPVAGYNLMISKRRFEDEVSKYFELVGFDGLGLYLFLSRIVHPLFVAPEAPAHRHPLNKTAMELQRSQVPSQDFDDCDYAGLYVLKRKA